MRESLKREEIIRRRRDIGAVMSTGKRVDSEPFTLRYKEREASFPSRRVAFLLNGKIKGAVVRNRLKRRLREIFRRNKHWFPSGYDYIIQVRLGAEGLKFDGLKERLKTLAGKVENVG
ncbi:MAG: ribonuclease P protein component [candidate division WOR-3 bacterium]